MTADPRSYRSNDVFRGLLLAALPSLAMWSVIALALRDLF